MYTQTNTTLAQPLIHLHARKHETASAPPMNVWNEEKQEQAKSFETSKNKWTFELRCIICLKEYSECWNTEEITLWFHLGLFLCYFIQAELGIWGPNQHEDTRMNQSLKKKRRWGVSKQPQTSFSATSEGEVTWDVFTLAQTSWKSQFLQLPLPINFGAVSPSLDSPTNHSVCRDTNAKC